MMIAYFAIMGSTKEPLKKTLTGKQLRKIRKSLGETQAVFATRLGYTNRITIAFKEAGTRPVNARDILLLQHLIPQSKSN